MNHTPEPWAVALSPSLENNPLPKRVLVGPIELARPIIAGVYGGEEISSPDATRIVACVNACTGLSNEALEGGAIRLLSEVLAASVASERPPLIDNDFPEARDKFDLACARAIDLIEGR